MSDYSRQIQDKLIEDFKLLEFDTGGLLFNDVKKFYAAETQGSRDLLLLPDSINENIVGNTETVRQYTYRALIPEFINATDSDTAGSNKYSRLLAIGDVLLDYLQKEPSNLNSWGSDNGINIFKIRVGQGFYDQRNTESGYAEIFDIRFSVFVNIEPQLL